MPRVSVLMSVYNGERFLTEAVDSILSQSLSDFEFVIVNDGSTDRTADILASYGNRLRVHSQTNEGLSRALNTGLSLATGEFIARMDADDISEPERLEMQVSFLRQHPEVGLLGSSFVEIDESGASIREVRVPTDDRDLRRALARYNPFAHASVMFRRDLAVRCGGYSEDPLYKHNSEDYELWIKMGVDSCLASIHRVLLRRRVHPGSLVASREDQRLRAAAVLRAKAIRAYGLPFWYWWHVVKPAIALRLSPSIRRLLRLVIYGRGRR